jgi:hypothetical protein
MPLLLSAAKLILFQAIKDGKIRYSKNPNLVSSNSEIEKYIAAIDENTVAKIVMNLSDHSSEKPIDLVSLEEYTALSSEQLNALTRLTPYGLTFAIAKTLDVGFDNVSVGACQALLHLKNAGYFQAVIKLDDEQECKTIEQALNIVMRLNDKYKYILNQHHACTIGFGYTANGFGYTLKDLTSLSPQQIRAVEIAVEARDSRRLSFKDGFNRLIAISNLYALSCFIRYTHDGSMAPELQKSFEELDETFIRLDASFSQEHVNACQVLMDWPEENWADTSFMQQDTNKHRLQKVINIVKGLSDDEINILSHRHTKTLEVSFTFKELTSWSDHQKKVLRTFLNAKLHIVSKDEINQLTTINLDVLNALIPYGINFPAAKKLGAHFDNQHAKACQALMGRGQSIVSSGMFVDNGPTKIKLNDNQVCQKLAQAIDIVNGLTDDDRCILSQHAIKDIPFGYTLEELTALSGPQKTMLKTALSANDCRVSSHEGFKALTARNEAAMAVSM